MGIDLIEGRTHHQRVWLADEIRLYAGGTADEGGDGACRRQRPVGSWTGGVGISGDKAGAADDQPDRLGDLLEAIGAGLPAPDVIRVAVGKGVPVGMERGSQPRLADDEGCAAWSLVAEKIRGRHRGRPDGVFG